MSEFGKKRLAEEDVLGPEELRMAPTLNNGEEGEWNVKPWTSFSNADIALKHIITLAISFPGDLDNLDDDGEIDPKTMERIRNYQLKRLEYYYAVAEFSSVEAADKVQLNFLCMHYVRSFFEKSIICVQNLTSFLFYKDFLQLKKSSTN